MDFANPKLIQISEHENKDDLDKDTIKEHFFPGEIFSQSLITDSYKKRKFLDPDDYFLKQVKARGRGSKGKVVPWKLTEIIKLFQVTDGCEDFHPEKMKILRCYLPKRSEAAMKAFASNHKEDGLKRTLQVYQRKLKSPYIDKSHKVIIYPTNTMEATYMEDYSKSAKKLPSDQNSDSDKENQPKTQEEEALSPQRRESSSLQKRESKAMTQQILKSEKGKKLESHSPPKAVTQTRE